jgi:hypothetical protein
MKESKTVTVKADDPRSEENRGNSLVNNEMGADTIHGGMRLSSDGPSPARGE